MTMLGRPPWMSRTQQVGLLIGAFLMVGINGAWSFKYIHEAVSNENRLLSWITAFIVSYGMAVGELFMSGYIFTPTMWGYIAEIPNAVATKSPMTQKVSYIIGVCLMGLLISSIYAGTYTIDIVSTAYGLSIDNKFMNAALTVFIVFGSEVLFFGATQSGWMALIMKANTIGMKRKLEAEIKKYDDNHSKKY